MNKYRNLVCEEYDDEVFHPNLHSLKADLESEGYSLDDAMKRDFLNPIIIKSRTKVYNEKL